MTASEQEKKNGASPPGMIKHVWLNPRRKRFWALLALILYTLLGFFAVPYVIKSSLVGLVEEDLGRSLDIEKVAFNPYALSLSVEQLEMRDSDGVKLAALDDFYINFQLSSLFRWAWTFKEFRLVNPYLYYERFAEDDSRLSRLLADAAKNSPQEQPVEEGDGGGLLRLLVQNFQLTGGLVLFKDSVPATPVEIPFGPINIEMEAFSTLPDKYGQQVVNIELPDDAKLHWQGNLALSPLDSKGELQLERANLGVITAYLKTKMPLESIAAKLSSGFSYHIRTDETGALRLDIDGLAVALDDVAISGLNPGQAFFKLKQLALLDGVLRYPEQRLEFAALKIDEPELTAWRNPDGSLSLSQLVPASSDDESEEEPEQPVKPWQMGLGELDLAKGQLKLSDRSIKPAGRLDIADLQINASGLTNQDGAKIPLQLAATFAKGGEIGVQAELQVLPAFSFTGTTTTRGIPLNLMQPYVQQYARLLVEQGTLDSDLVVAVPAGKQLSIRGSLAIPRLEIKDTVERKRLLAWDKLSIETLNLDLGAGLLKLSPLQFDRPFGRIIIYPDKTTNLSGLAVTKAAPPSEAAERKSDQDFNLVIAGAGIKDGGMDFSDLSLPLHFATTIKKLNGTVSTIASGSTEPAAIKLEGQVDEYGLSRINGAINLLDPLYHMGIKVEFRNLLMSALSPYTVEFAGRKIAEGRLDLDLRYDIEKSRLKANNKVVISDLKLGDKVEHPGAANLPLGLAVALLKDVNGVIDISLPIQGNIDDPEFRIGGIIWQAFTGLITKVVASPFSLLGSLIGVESEDLGEFQFLAGRSDLTPPELEKVVQLKQALLQRPKLGLEIKGVVAPAIDVPALKYQVLEAILIEREGDAEPGEAQSINMLDDDVRRTLEKLYKERVPDEPLKRVKTDNMTPPADDPEGRPVLDKLAYSASLRDRLLETIVIGEAELKALAQSRAEAIQAAFLANELDASRISIVGIEEVKPEDDQWIKLVLGITSK
jgi:hypothetical protein